MPVAPATGAAAMLLAALMGGCNPAASQAPASTAASETASGSIAPPATTGSPSAPATVLRLVMDTDMAPDDVTALASLLRDPGVELLAIAVDGTGEAHCPGGMFVARSVVTMLRDDPIPVTCGPRSPIGAAEPFPDDWGAGADTGNGLSLISPAFTPDPREAPQLLVELADAEAAAGRRLTILTTGTLTNLAAALELDPSFARKVVVVSMLGAVRAAGNVTTQTDAPTAEWNAHADPTAAQRVLDAGVELTLIPLDATNDAPLTHDLYAALAGDHAAGPADLVYELWSRNSWMLDSGFYLWDPLASVAIREPSVVTTSVASIRVVEGDGPDGGRLVEDPNGAAVTIATAADRPAFEAYLLSRLRIGAPREVGFETVGTVRVLTGGGACEATLDPPVPPAGLLRIEASNTTAEAAGAVVFELGPVSWAEIESIAKNGIDAGQSPPPVHEVAYVEAPPGGSATSFGESPAGQLGVACFSGTDPEAPDIAFAGPFPIGP
jgi:inosine-uridine nucleoside N-ribohydrolase